MQKKKSPFQAIPNCQKPSPRPADLGAEFQKLAEMVRRSSVLPSFPSRDTTALFIEHSSEI
jgi:hypothetical protein